MAIISEITLRERSVPITVYGKTIVSPTSIKSEKWLERTCGAVRLTEEMITGAGYYTIPSEFSASFRESMDGESEADYKIAMSKAYGIYKFREYSSKGEILMCVKGTDFIVEMGEFLTQSASDLEWTFKRNIPLPATETNDLGLAVAKIVKRIDDFTEEFAAAKSFLNKKIGVHLSGNQMLLYNHVKLLSDACTDDLQKELRDGWRIIAVCPQEARRPDYILGCYINDENPNPLV